MLIIHYKGGRGGGLEMTCILFSYSLHSLVLLEIQHY